MTIGSRATGAAGRLHGWVGAASRWLRGRLLVALLAGVYLGVLPTYALVRRLRKAAPRGWRQRNEADLTSLRRLREPF